MDQWLKMMEIKNEDEEDEAEDDDDDNVENQTIFKHYSW